MPRGDQEEFTFKPLTQGLGFRNGMLGLPSETLPSLAEEEVSIDSILKSVKEHREQRLSRPLMQETVISEYEISPARFELLAGFLDALFVTTGFIVFLISLVTITGVDLNTAFTPFDTQVGVALITTYGCIGFSYLFLSRVFLGSTFGEWAFDQILGTPSQQQKKSYYAFVALRSLVSTLTGFFLIPAISLLTRKDFFSSLTPLKIWQVNGTRYIRSRS